MKPLLLLFFLLLISCAAEENDPKIDKVSENFEFETTGPTNACATHEECWCKSFDGAKFKNEKEISKCCFSGDKSCTKPGYCVACLYD